jgi:hypothetical protein
VRRPRWRIELQSECATKREQLRAIEEQLQALTEARAEGERAALERTAARLRRRVRALDLKRPRPSADGMPLVENRSPLDESVRFLGELAKRFDLSRLSVALVAMEHVCPGPVDGYYRRPPERTRGWMHSIGCVVDPGAGYPTWAVPDLDGLEATQPGAGPARIGWVGDAEEAGVVSICHELFHFLRSTRQVTERNTERNANLFAWDCLLRFRAWRA